MLFQYRIDNFSYRKVQFKGNWSIDLHTSPQHVLNNLNDPSWLSIYLRVKNCTHTELPIHLFLKTFSKIVKQTLGLYLKQ